MLGCELLDGRLRLLLESQSGLTFAGVLHHLHFHLFTGREHISHKGSRSHKEGEKAHRAPPTLLFPTRHIFKAGREVQI